MIKRPNIIFIMADQLGASFVGAYGSGVNSTPTLDHLAEEGARFDRCYANVPLCAPNRATILTGRSATIHGVNNNNLELKTDVPTYAHVLKSNGYRVGGFGKFHQTPMQRPLPKDFAYLGFDESIPTEDPKLGPWLDWIEGEHPQHYETALAMSWPMPYLKEYGPDKKNLLPRWIKAREEIITPLRKESEWRTMYASPLPKELHQTAYITDCSLDFMQRHTDTNPDKPFFCHISYVDPHDPYDPPAPYDTMFAPEDMPAPISMTGDKYDCNILEQSRDFCGFRAIDGNIEALRKLRALYHGSIKFIDDQIKRVVDFIGQRNLWDNTILVFTTDHGDMMGDHGLITKGVKHYDSGIRCPLIVYGCGVTPIHTDRLTSSLDFFPTFCDWAGIDERPLVEGKSFAPVCRGEEGSEWPEVIVHLAADDARVVSIITNDGWRLTVFDEDGQGEMFYLKEDPCERNNLYYSDSWSEKRHQLFERLIKAYIRSGAVQQYRNMPVQGDKRCVLTSDLNEFSKFVPNYDKT